MRKLELELDAQRPTEWIDQLSSFVALKTVSEVIVSGSALSRPEPRNVDDIGECLRLMPNLQSLDIHCSYWQRPGWLSSPQCSMIPPSVRHLTLGTGSYNGWVAFLERFDQLWSFGWAFATEEPTAESLATLKNWLEENRPGSSCENERRSLHIWLGSERTISRNKRRKHAA